MGTSRNLRSPSAIRWRAVHTALGESSKPRAVGQIFLAAQGDGWAEALASSAVARFAIAASAAWEVLPTTIIEHETPGQAIRTLVDRAHRDSVATSTYVSSGLMPGLAERALVGTLVARMQTRTRALHDLNTREARESWLRKRGTTNALAASFMDEAVRGLTLHLIMRDAGVLVGDALGGAAAVQALAWEVAEVAVAAARPGHDMLLVEPAQAVWAQAVTTAWSQARDVAVLDESITKRKPGQP